MLLSKEATHQHETKEDSKFVLSCGCPVIHLAEMEVIKASQVILEFKHEVTTEDEAKYTVVVKEEWSQLIYFLQKKKCVLSK